jgi:hypothetical protein
MAYRAFVVENEGAQCGRRKENQQPRTSSKLLIYSVHICEFDRVTNIVGGYLVFQKRCYHCAVAELKVMSDRVDITVTCGS